MMMEVIINNMSSKIEFVKEFDKFITFNSNSEKESLEIGGVSCEKELSTSPAKIKFNIYEDDICVSQGLITTDDTLVFFTSTDTHNRSYIRLMYKLLNEYNNTLTTYTSSWYYKSRLFLKKLGFYLAKDYGKIEEWVLVKRK